MIRGSHHQKELTRLPGKQAHFSLYRKPETDKGPTMDSPQWENVQFIRFTKNSLKIGRKLSCIVSSTTLHTTTMTAQVGLSVLPKLMEDMEKIKNEMDGYPRGRSQR
jgi:hypothetical protein